MSFLKDIFNRFCLDKNKNKNKKSDIKEFKIQEKLINYECIICLDELNIGETVSLIKCGHIYHSECLYTWLLKKPVCPLCDEELFVA